MNELNNIEIEYSECIKSGTLLFKGEYKSIQSIEKKEIISIMDLVDGRIPIEVAKKQIRFKIKQQILNDNIDTIINNGEMFVLVGLLRKTIKQIGQLKQIGDSEIDNIITKCHNMLFVNTNKK